MKKKGNKSRVIGIILAYRHAEYLPGLYQKLRKIHQLDEIIIANDESEDGIEKIAKRLGVPCFSHPRLGYGGNMKYGMHKAIDRGGDYLVEIHGDGQFDIEFIGPAIAKMKQGFDLVLGTRFIDAFQPLRDKMPIIKYIANIGLTFLENLVLGVWISEYQTGARVYSKKAIQAVDLDSTSNSFNFGFEIIAQIIFKGFRVGEVPVRSYYGQKHSSISFKNSVVYVFATMLVLVKFILAKIGFKTKLFS